VNEIPEHTRQLPFHLMSPQVTEQATAYAEAHTTPRSAAVEALAQETTTTTATPQMMGGAVEARLLEGLLVATQARHVLEIGTFTGATALALAEALPADARLTTIESDEELAAMARRHLDASPHGGKVDLRLGDAREILAELDGPFELVFIDAWKQDYVDYYEATLPKLADRGLIVADNVVWWGLPFQPDADDPETEGVRRFVAHVLQDPRTHNALLTVGDGLMVIWKTSEEETR
jgi:caffeoyl-CoA O-methyltransferase